MKSYVKNYPRPQFYRAGYQLLDGIWDFAFDDQNAGEKAGFQHGFDKQHDIVVPFSYETKLSGIGDETRHDVVWYHKTVQLDANWCEKNTVLHFEGSDYVTKVWVNGQFVGTHQGGYARFSFDITNQLVVGDNQISVKVEDSFDTQQPRGKQRWKDENFGCWYVQTTGIWKSVWIEQVNPVHLQQVKMTPSIQDHSVIVEGSVVGNTDNTSVTIDITFGDIAINQVTLPVKMGTFYAKINVLSDTAQWGVHLWSPQNPALYDISFALTQDGAVLDQVASYFGMREIRIKDHHILLNNIPLYQRLILDQGYWEDSHLTPPSEEALIEDIDKIFALGYNGLRKHQKIEDERFLYWCDVKGMLVWSEMAATYSYSDKAVEAFTKEWMEIVRQNYNHPAIITWTPINESWGVPQVEVDYKQQQFTEMVYHLTKSMDDMRPVIVNDGWEHTISDIITLHDYQPDGDVFYDYYKDKDKILSNELYHNRFKCAFANGYSYKGQPVLISEFGGIAFNNDDSGWGYGDKVQTKEDFVARFDSITNGIKKLPYVCGYCYTQVTDVQQEINGLMYIDRSFKIDPQIIKDINLANIEQFY